jgi:hypothetical protein
MSDDPIPPIVIPPEGDDPEPDAGSGGGGHSDPDKPGK